MAVTDYDIPTLERTINGRRSMRSVADALEALRNAERLPLGSLLEVRTSPLPARNADRPSIVIVVCRGGLSEHTWGVALPTSYEFSGRPLGKNAAETFEISLLHRARIDVDGTVMLSDGTCLQAVNVVPAALPWELTELQRRIVYWTIKFSSSKRMAGRRDLRATRQRLAVDLKVIIQTIQNPTGIDKQEKFGRYLGLVWIDGVNVNELLISKGFAVHREY